jgi:hypothetical protein
MAQPNANMDYETVAAGTTGQVLGLLGAKGDYVERLVIVPATTGPGLVTLIDGSTSIPIMVTGGTTTLVPIVVELNIVSQTGAWSVTTGSNVSVIAIGDFTRSAYIQ